MEAISRADVSVQSEQQLLLTPALTFCCIVYLPVVTYSPLGTIRGHSCAPLKSLVRRTPRYRHDVIAQ